MSHVLFVSALFLGGTAVTSFWVIYTCQAKARLIFHLYQTERNVCGVTLVQDWQLVNQVCLKKLQPINRSILSPACPSVLPDGWPAGGQKDLHHQRGPAVPQAAVRGRHHDWPGLLHATLPAAAGRHQSQRVRQCAQSVEQTRTVNTTQEAVRTCLSTSRIVKVPDNPDSLSFRLSGSAPPHVHAVRKGEKNV